MAQFTGTWQIDNSTGFDDYMKAIGKTSFSRLLLLTFSYIFISKIKLF